MQNMKHIKLLEQTNGENAIQTVDKQKLHKTDHDL
jgi:hypothetical protein